MCGRYTLKETHQLQKDLGVTVLPSYNIVPSARVLVINSEHKPVFLTWSYKPRWLKNSSGFINARGETLNVKRSFRAADRCIILSDGWFEWKRSGGQNIPYYFHANSSLLYFAGVSDGSGGCAIVTTAASMHLEAIHHRQPCLFSREEADGWLLGGPISISRANEAISYYAVVSLVNRTVNNSSANLVRAITNESDCLI
jgi:putative SOS response-associated peptidase YedK